jgi:Sec-independent protein secretion pathway component TatC
VTFRTQRRVSRFRRRVLAFPAVMVVALSSVAASLGLIFVFFVVFPVLVQGLIAFAIAQVMGERAENQAYIARRRARRQ